MYQVDIKTLIFQLFIYFFNIIKYNNHLYMYVNICLLNGITCMYVHMNLGLNNTTLLKLVRKLLFTRGMFCSCYLNDNCIMNLLHAHCASTRVSAYLCILIII